MYQTLIKKNIKIQCTTLVLLKVKQLSLLMILDGGMDQLNLNIRIQV